MSIFKGGRLHRNRCTEFLSYDRRIRAKRDEKCTSAAEKELREEQALFGQRKDQVLRWHCLLEVVT